MDHPAFLDRDPALYAGLIQLFRRNTVRVLEEDADGVFIQDTHGVTYMLAYTDAALARRWLDRHRDEPCPLMMLIGDGAVADYAAGIFRHEKEMRVYQAVYEKTAPPAGPRRLRIETASAADVPFVAAHYSELDMPELMQIAADGELFVGCGGQGERVGFVGRHLEGSMGLLHVLPEHRRMGYGAELERFMIARMLEKGLIPYCQFEIHNAASRSLQRSLGLRITDTEIRWLY